MAELSTGSRLEVNLAWYFGKQFTPRSSAPRFFNTNNGECYNDPETDAPPQHYVVIRAMNDVRESEQFPNAELLALAVEVVSTVDGYPDSPKTHKALVEKLYRSLVDVPVSNLRTLRASQNLLRSINRVPGSPDTRPEKEIHLWDLRDMALSVDGRTEGMVISSIFMGTATCSPTFWPSARPYGDI